MFVVQVLRLYVLPLFQKNHVCRFMAFLGRVRHAARLICSIQKGFRPT